MIDIPFESFVSPSGVPSSFHTHTCFCDGRDTPEAMVQEAIRLGCPAIGFSGHSHTAFDEGYCMSKDGTQAYCEEIRRLRQVYGGQIRIFLGIEQDYFSDALCSDYDYVIGSVHYVCKNGEYRPVDHTAACQQAIVDDWFGGDFYAFAEAYYALVADVWRKTHCSIVGHFDLISKFNEHHELFDPNHPRYTAAADRALAELMPAPVVFEINTGAISRGCRETPYPDPRILSVLQKNHVRLLRTSDCHRKENLLFGLSARTGR